MIAKILNGREKKVAQDTHWTNADVVCNFRLDRFSIFRVINVKSFCEKRKRSMIAKIFDGREKTNAQNNNRTNMGLVYEFELNRSSRFGEI